MTEKIKHREINETSFGDCVVDHCCRIEGVGEVLGEREGGRDSLVFNLKGVVKDEEVAEITCSNDQDIRFSIAKTHW